MKSKKTSPAKVTTARTPDPTPEQVAALAHAIWIDRGCPAGRDLDNWLEAERQLGGEVRKPVAADDLPASETALDPDRALESRVERELNRIVAKPEPRSATSL